MKYSNLTFPSNLEKNISPYILMIGQRWGTKYKKDMTAEFISFNDYISIALPLPTNGLIDATTHNWTSTEDALLNISKENVGKMVAKGVIEKVKTAFGNLASAQQFESGKTINDYAALLYGGQNFRQFDWDFDLLPENSEDAQLIHKIINGLKYGSLTKSLGTTLRYPFFWTIQILKPNGEKYFTLERCVINNLTINRFQGDVNTIHTDGEPILTSLSIGFSELYKEWADNYD